MKNKNKKRTFVVSVSAYIGLAKRIRAETKEQAEDYALETMNVPQPTINAFTESDCSWDVCMGDTEPIFDSVETEEMKTLGQTDALEIPKEWLKKYKEKESK